MDRDSIERTLRRIGLPVAAAIVALGIGGVLVATLGQSPLAAAQTVIRMLTAGLILTLLAGIALKLKLFGEGG